MRLAPALFAAALLLPIAAGLASTLLPALKSEGFQKLAAWQGLPRAAALSVGTGVVSTALALGVTVVMIGCLQGTAGFSAFRRMLSPLLALPHAAAALGLAFLISPSGWIARALSPGLTGWTQPPDLLILNDPWGLALTAGLVAKEVPFLLLMALAALPQTEAAQRGLVAASLGYGRAAGFALTTLPALSARLRLPVLAVLAYGMTNVDMAMILGPSLPPTLAVQITRWMAEPGLAHLPEASAAAALQLALVAAVLAVMAGLARLARPLIPALALRGARGRGWDAPLAALSRCAALGIALGLGAGLAGLGLWSVAGLWQFPDALPAGLTLTTWAKSGPELLATGRVTLGIALASSLAALTLCLAVLEAETRRNRPWRGEPLLYLPLILPQIAVLPGLQVLALGLGAKGGALPVAAAHLVFVAPYVWLSLAPAFRGWDGRQALIGAALGASPARIFWALRLPMLLAPALTALAVGIAVSVGQYLPTLMLGGGRVETLTTEALALASGGNRRLIGAVGLMQMVLPALGFALAMALPRLVFANRRGLRTDQRL